MIPEYIMTGDEVVKRLPGVSKRSLKTMSLAGLAPPFLQLSPKGKMLFIRDVTESWIARKLTPVMGAAQ